jgi:hypothetical protein
MQRFLNIEVGGKNIYQCDLKGEYTSADSDAGNVRLSGRGVS